MCFDFLYKFFPEIFPIQRRIRWEIIIKVYQSSRESQIILVRFFKIKLEFSLRIFEKKKFK